MTEAPQRPGPVSVLALVLLGSAVFIVPQLFRQPGWFAEVDDAALAAELVGFVPLAELSYRLDAWFASGLPVEQVMHFHSVLLHVLTAVAVLFCLTGHGVTAHRAIAGAAVFLVHPAVLEPATVVGMRPALLAGLFAVLSLGLAHRAALGGQLWPRVGAALLAAAAVLSHPHAVVLPILGLVLGLRRKDYGTSAIGLLAGGALLAFGAALATAGLPATFALPGVLEPLAGLLWPTDGAFVLRPMYSGQSAAIVGGVVLLALAVTAGVERRARPQLAGALAILCVAGLLGGLTSRLMPDFASYLAVFGLAGVVAGCPLPKMATVTVAAAVVLACAIVDVVAAANYKDAATLYGRIAARSPYASYLQASRVAKSSLTEERRRAREILTGALAALPENRDRLAALRLQVDLDAGLGDTAAASQGADAMCALGKQLAVPKAEMFTLYREAADRYRAENAPAKVADYYALMTALDPEHADVIARRAEQSYIDLVKALRREKNDMTIGNHAGFLAVDDPRIPKIQADLDRALAKDPACFYALALSGRLATATGAALSAVKFYQRAIAARPDFVIGHTRLASHYHATEQPQKAEMVVRKALQKLDDAALHFLLTTILAGQNRADEAELHLRSFVKNRPHNRDACVLLANLLSAKAINMLDRLDAAQLDKLATEIEELNADDPKGWIVRAAVFTKVHPKRRRYLPAIVLLERAHEKMRGDRDVLRRLAEAHRDYGYSLMFASKKEQAMDHFLKFLALAPKGARTQAVVNAVVAHCKTLEREGVMKLKEDSKFAEAAFRRSSQLRPDRPRAYHFLGIALVHQEKLEAAVGAFDKAIDLGTKQGKDVSHYVLPLVNTLQDMGRRDEAKRRGEAFLAKVSRHSDPRTVAAIRKLLQ